MAEPLTFFEHLWPNGVPEESRLLIWTLKDKRSYYAETLPDAAAYVGDHGARTDTYFGAALAPTGLTRRQRAKMDVVTGIPGFWIDLDYDDPAHKKANLPTQDEADVFIVETWDPLPHVIVNSGHGYQLWWLFEEPWMFSGPDDRAEAQAMAQAWTYSIRDLMRLQGWDLDATFDLARVMRTPGTTNFKGTEPTKATVNQYTDAPREPVQWWRESLADQLAIPVAEPPSGRGLAPASSAGGETRPQAARAATAGGFTLDPAATPPFDKWEALQAHDPKVVKTWNRRRTDYSDQTASSYDYGLANYTVRAGWSDQEIINLLIAHRRKHGDDLKLRVDYYARTIDRARGSIDQEQIAEAFDDEDDEETTDPDEILRNLSSLFGVKLIRIVKYLGDPPLFMLVVDQRGEEQQVSLGGVEALLWQRTFRAKVAGAIGHVLPTQSTAKWDKLAQAMLNAVTEEELADEATPAGLARSWVREYLQNVPPAPDEPDAQAEAIVAGRPYLLADDRAGVSLASMQTWVRTVKGERITVKELARNMRSAGWVQERRHVPLEGGGRTTRSVYVGTVPA